MNLRELKLIGRKGCCNHIFTAKDITSIHTNTDYHFYGGRVEYYSIARCPKCGQEVVLLLEAYDNSYRVVDIAIEKYNKKPKIEIITKQELASKESNKLICPKCKREFKSKSGLTSHMRKCQ